jgi:hypothetical protein
MTMRKRGEIMSGRTGNIIATVYLFLSGIFTLNFLPDSIATHASGIAFLIAAVYGAVSIARNTDYLFRNN